MTAMELPRRLNKPYFLFRPGQLVRRMGRMVGAGSVGTQRARLAWGMDIDYEPHDALGSSLAKTGVYELPVSEMIHRLLDPGELAVDAGANIGYITSLMAARVGGAGRVLAFEPHPDVFARLRENARRWERSSSAAKPELYDLALSDRLGPARLYVSDDFQTNMGVAFLEEAGWPAPADGRVLEVSLITLDEVLTAGERVGLLKIDVEGHEPHVLAGAGGLLEEGRIRDIVFEEWTPFPTETTRVLESYGYTLYGLAQGLLGVSLVAPTSRSAEPLWDAPTFLATREPERARARASRRGWRVLGR